MSRQVQGEQEMTVIISDPVFRHAMQKYMKLAETETVVITKDRQPWLVLISSNAYDGLLGY